MPCLPIVKGNRRIGFFCIPNEPIKLMRGVWMEWHRIFGPTFYSDPDCQKEIPEWWKRRRLVENFERWKAANPNA